MQKRDLNITKIINSHLIANHEIILEPSPRWSFKINALKLMHSTNIHFFNTELTIFIDIIFNCLYVEKKEKNVD